MSKVPGWARKSRVVLLTIISAGIVFASTTQTWLNVELPEQAVPTEDLTIPGSTAATAVTALALVALAGAIASTIAGRVLRTLIGVIIFAAAGGIIASALAVALNPAAAAESEIAEAIGIIGSSAQTSVTVFPAIAIAGGGLLAVSAVVVILAGRYWTSSKRFEAGNSADGSHAPAGPEAEAGRDATEPAADVDEIESWDQLSRGKDPTN
jgi:uncharacterized membrane protein (TIGR02234 family)